MICRSHGTLGCFREQPDGVIRCSFDQSKPDGGVLIEGDNKTRTLTYRAPDGEIFVVPNVGYNQPLAWRIRTMQWQIERCRERAKGLAAQPSETSQSLSKDMEGQAVRLEAKLAEMRCEGAR
jgi:hypothetical protein